MKEIVFLGNSPACISAIEEIRKQDKESRIRMISRDRNLPFGRHLIAPWISKDISEEDSFIQKQEFFDAHNVEVLFEKKIVKVDLKRNRLISQEKETFNFDILVITDVQSYRFPDIKGIQKKGVFGLKRMGDIQEILTLLPYVETSVVQGDSIQAVLMACSLRKRVSEVILALPSSGILPSMFDEDSGRFLAQLLEEKGIRIFKNSSISEILGDGEVKAIRFPQGKVVACQIVIFDNVKQDLRLFQNSPLEFNEGIAVNESFRTNIENIFAVDEACQTDPDVEVDDFEMSSSFLSEQGRTVGQNIIGEPVAFSSPFRALLFHPFDISVAIMGRTKPQLVWREFKEINQTQKLFKKIYSENNVICGAVLVNASDKKEKILQFIKEKRDINTLAFNVFEESCSLKENMNSISIDPVLRITPEENEDVLSAAGQSQDQKGQITEESSSNVPSQAQQQEDSPAC